MRRRLPAIVLCLGVALASAASGHPVIVESEVPIETATDLPIAILADEAAPLVAVEIEAPDSYTILEVVSAPGWTVTHTDRTVRLSGKTIAVGTQSDLVIRGIAHRAGQIVLVVITHAADGRERRWDGASSLSAFPGVILDVIGAPASGGGSAGTYVLVVVFLLVVGGGGLALRRQQRPVVSLSEPETTEIEERT